MCIPQILQRTTVAVSHFSVDSLPPGEDNMMEKAKEPVVTEIATTGEFDAPYRDVFGDVSKIIDAARESAARSVNAAMTAAYWLTGRRIVEFEQSGTERAKYGAALLERLAADLTGRFGRGFSRQNVQNMRLFYPRIHLSEFARHCLANWLHALDNRFARRRLANWNPTSPSRTSATFCWLFPCPGPPTCACSR